MTTYLFHCAVSHLNIPSNIGDLSFFLLFWLVFRHGGRGNGCFDTKMEEPLFLWCDVLWRRDFHNSIFCIANLNSTEVLNVEVLRGVYGFLVSRLNSIWISQKIEEDPWYSPHFDIVPPIHCYRQSWLSNVVPPTDREVERFPCMNCHPNWRYLSWKGILQFWVLNWWPSNVRCIW